MDTNSQPNQIPQNILPPETSESVSVINKRRWTVFFSIWVILFELGLLYFYAASFADRILHGSWADLGALAVSIYVGIPLCIIGLYLTFLNYRQAKKIFALILFVLSISITPLFSLKIGQSLAPMFPGVIEAQKESLIASAKLDKKVKSDTSLSEYARNRYSELEKYFQLKLLILGVTEYLNESEIELSDGKKLTLIYSGIYDQKIWKDINLQNIQIKLPDLADFTDQYLYINNIYWNISGPSSVKFNCLLNAVNTNSYSVCNEKIPVLVYSNNILVNGLFYGSGTELLSRYQLK